MKNFIISPMGLSIIVVALFIIVIANGSGEGIHAIPPDAVIIEGSCITMNWSISKDNMEAAIELFLELREGKQEPQGVIQSMTSQVQGTISSVANTIRWELDSSKP